MPNSPRLHSLAAFEHRPLVLVEASVLGRHPKPVTRAAVSVGNNPYALLFFYNT